MKLTRIAARLGAAALTAVTFGAAIGVMAPPAGALTAQCLQVQVQGIDLSSKLWISGQTFTVTVTAKNNADCSGTGVDSLYAGTVTMSFTGTSDSPPAPYTFVPAVDQGVHNFSVTLNSLANGITIGATDATSLPSHMTPTSVNVAPKLVVSGITDPIQVTGTSPVAVTARNFADTQTLSGYRGKVQFTSSVGVTNLPPDYTFVAGDNGRHVFSGVTFPSAGEMTVTATDPDTATTGSQSAITVVPKLVVSVPTSPVLSGTAQNVTVTAQDGDLSTFTSYTGTVHFTSNDAQANLPADYTFTGSGAGKDNGTHTFTNGVTLNTPGARTVSAVDAVVTGTSSAVNVAPLLAVTGITNPMTAGVFSDVTVTAKMYDNTHTLQTFSGYNGVVQFTTNDPSGAVLVPDDFTFLAGNNGTHTFSSALKLVTPGSRTVTATDKFQPLTTGTSPTISVNAGLQITGISDPIDLDPASSSMTVTAIDGAGAPLTNYVGTVHFTSTDAGAVLPADYTFVAGDNGSHQFSGVKFHTAGDQSVTATDTGNAAVTGTLGGITVIPKIVVSNIASPSFTSVKGPVTVTAVNFGNSPTTATGYRGTVSFASDHTGDTVPDNYTFTALDAGTHTFTNAVAFAATGAHAVTVQDVLSVASAGSQSAINVVDPIVTSTATPTTDVVHTTHTVTATVNDGNGHNIPDGTTIHFVATRPGTTDAVADVAASAGSATWTFTSDTVGTSTVSVSAGTFAASPKTVSWTPGPLATIILTTDPQASLGETTLVIATAFDAFSNLVANGTPINFTAGGTGSEFPTSDTQNTFGGNAVFEFFSDDFGTSTVNAASGAVHATPVNIDWISGYWVFSSNGGVDALGDAPYFGSMVGQHLNGQIIGAARTPTGLGYWLVGSDGGIFTFGDALFYGSTGSTKLNAPVIGMAATPSGHGYWLVAADGGIFTFGDAGFYGSTGSKKLNQPVFAMAPTADGLGYWLVARDGGIFTFGNAVFYGSTGGMKLNKPIVGAATTLTGAGYWLVGGDGGIFTFGDAPFFGSAANQANSVFTGMAPTFSGLGYWIVSKNGTVNTYGDAPNYGSGHDGAVAIVSSH